MTTAPLVGTTVRDEALDFDTLLDQAIAQVQAGVPVEQCLAAYPEMADDLRPLVELAQITMHVAPVSPPAGAKARVRAQVMAGAERRLAARPWWHPATLLGGMRLQPAGFAAAGAAALIALGGGGALVASASALPGDALYPVKLVTEDARLTAARLTANQQAEAELHASFAERRVAEVAALAAQGKPVPEQVVSAAVQQASVAEQLTSALPEPKRAQVAAKLDASQDQREITLSRVQQQVPAPAASAIAHALEEGRAKQAERGHDNGRSQSASPSATAPTAPTALSGGSSQRSTSVPAPTGTPASPGEDRRDDREEERGPGNSQGNGASNGVGPGNSNSNRGGNGQAGSTSGGPGNSGSNAERGSGNGNNGNGNGSSRAVQSPAAPTPAVSVRDARDAAITVATVVGQPVANAGGGTANRTPPQGQSQGQEAAGAKAEGRGDERGDNSSRRSGGESESGPSVTGNNGNGNGSGPGAGTGSGRGAGPRATATSTNRDDSSENGRSNGRGR